MNLSPQGPCDGMPPLVERWRVRRVHPSVRGDHSFGIWGAPLPSASGSGVVGRPRGVFDLPMVTRGKVKFRGMDVRWRILGSLAARQGH